MKTNLLNKVLCAITAVSTFCSCLITTCYAESDAVFADVSKSSPYCDAIERLSALGIVNGYDDGEYKPNNYVTRAEFSKIVVAMLDKMTEAKSTPSTSAFDDVNSVGWCIPYVNYLTSNGIIKGYADATFKPNNVITYAEAVTILLRLLDYNDEDIGYNWPLNYINQADSIELSNGMNYSSSASVTRGDMAVICDNALFCDVNGSSDVMLIESIGYTIIEDCFIAATKAEESSLGSKEIRTSSGVYEVKNTDILNKVHQIGTLTLNRHGDAITFSEKPLDKADATITELGADNSVTYKTNGGQKGKFTFNSNFVVYSDNNKTTYSAAAQKIKVGTNLTFFKEKDDNEWAFATINSTGDTTVPVRATKNYTSSDKYLEGTPINYDGLTVYKDNKTVSVGDIELNDVVYYNTYTNTMDVYTKKVTGIYNSASPSKAYVTSVNVGGNVYSINPDVSTASLDATNGSFALGERVTLLLGENDEVCFAVELSETSHLDYGVVLKTYTEISTSGDNEGSSQTMVSILMSDGNTYEYETDKNYKSYIGELVKLSYSNSIVTLTKASSSNIYGDLDVDKRTLGGKTVFKDVVVFHRLSDKDADVCEVELLDFDTLTETKIGLSQLITSVSANAFGDVSVLYLCNMVSGYNFGVLRGIEDIGGENSTSATYSIYHGANTVSYTSDARYSVSSGPVYYKLSGGKITAISALSSIASASRIDAVEGGRIMINGRIYKMSDDVQIVNRTNSTAYKTMSLNELKNANVSSVKIYSESKESDSCVIRVVMVTAQ